MAGNFWQSTHYQQWMLEKADLLRGRAEDLKVLTEEEYQKLMIFFCDFIQECCQDPQMQNKTRMQLVATAILYFRRFYARRSLKDICPFVMSTTCIILASKVEEYGMIPASKMAAAYGAALKKWPFLKKEPSYRPGVMQECEFFLLEILDCCLIVYHPYRPLTQMWTELAVVYKDSKDVEELKSVSWKVCNDSLKTDASLLYPPHLIAIACLMIAAVYTNRDLKSWFAELQVDFEKVFEIQQMIFGMYNLAKNFKESEQLMPIIEKMPKPSQSTPANPQQQQQQQPQSSQHPMMQIPIAEMIALTRDDRQPYQILEIPFGRASEAEVDLWRSLQAIVDQEGDRPPPRLEFVVSSKSDRCFRNPFQNQDISRIKFGRSEILPHIEELCDLVANRRMDNEEKVGPYVGVSGIAFTLHRASKTFEGNPELSSRLLKMSHELQALTQQFPSISSDSLRYLLGRCGFLAVNLVTSFDLSNSQKQLAELEKVGRAFAEQNPRTNLWDELFCGRSGFLAAVLMLRQTRNIPLKDDVVKGVLKAIVDSGESYSHRHHSSSPLMFEYHGREYFGAAHGLCGIVQMLLNFHDHLTFAQLPLVKGTVEWLMTTQDVDGNFPSSTGHIGESHHSLVHWCHGAPGFALLFLTAYRVFGEKKYLQAMERALDCIWERGFLRKGPGLCHGLSGNGYIFLLAYRHTRRVEYYHKARMFAMTMFTSFHRLANTPDSPFSLFEGWAGAICLLADLIEPFKAQFPLYPLRDYAFQPDSI